MTPAQLEHLKLIDAHLERLLAIAEKRTPGKWDLHYPKPGTDLPCCTGRAPEGLTFAAANTTTATSEQNAAFIASCAGNAEAGWRATRAVVQNWIDLGDYLGVSNPKNNLIHLPVKQSALLESILAAFPLELIQKP